MSADVNNALFHFSHDVFDCGTCNAVTKYDYINICGALTLLQRPLFADISHTLRLSNDEQMHHALMFLTSMPNGILMHPTVWPQ